MFFLLRMAFWLGLVMLLLPGDKTPETDKLPQIGAADAVSAASAAVSDMSQFCARQPDACAVGSQAATVIGQRAQAGARKLYDIITDKSDKTGDKTEKTDKPGEKPVSSDKPAKTEKAGKAEKIDRHPDHTGSIGDPTEAAATPEDTLTPADLQIDWQSPHAAAAEPEPQG